MLEELYIKDFALIHEIHLNFGSGLNIITGETGAGKSIILGALSLVLGNKASTDLIRSGAKRSIVQASFDITKIKERTTLEKILDDKGIIVDQESLILKREISADGRGRNFINSNQVPVHLLKEISRFLIEIHGQNENQKILQASTHRKLLDRYCNFADKITELAKYFNVWKKTKEQLESVSLNEDEKVKRLQILEYEINDLKSIPISDDKEFENLISKEKNLANSEQIMQTISECYHELHEKENSIISALSKVENSLEKVIEFDEKLKLSSNKLREAYYFLEEATSELKELSGEFSLDSSSLSEFRENLDAMHKLLRRYGPKVIDLFAYKEKVENEIESIHLSGEAAEKLIKEIKAIEKTLIKSALDVSTLRKKGATDLENAVKKELQDLGMADSIIKISVKWEFGENGIFEKESNSGKKYIIHPFGLDIIELLISSSEKDLLRPLRKIASGGELSRVMLALKKVIMDSDSVPVMIFDEVDAGIGGRIAEAVGKKLASLASSAQVIVITHLHQIAALNQENLKHFKVIKKSESGTSIIALSEEERINEIARMIGGEEISSSALRHAKQILSGK